MEKFLLNLINSTYEFSQYFRCEEIRCGIFVFDSGRPLPFWFIVKYNLWEVIDWDEERGHYYGYTPRFNA